VFLNPPHTLEVSIGSKLKALRLQAGMTQVQLCQAAGILQSVYTRYETESVTPLAPRLKAIAKALGVSLEEILEDSPTPSMPEHKTHVHGNSREAKVQELFRQLDEEAQRVILKQMKAMAQPPATTDTPKRRRNAA
jgi:transcriptional regulator with XRE-family HTH domain